MFSAVVAALDAHPAISRESCRAWTLSPPIEPHNLCSALVGLIYGASRFFDRLNASFVKKRVLRRFSQSRRSRGLSVCHVWSQAKRDMNLRRPGNVAAVRSRTKAVAVAARRGLLAL